MLFNVLVYTEITCHFIVNCAFLVSIHFFSLGSPNKHDFSFLTLILLLWIDQGHRKLQSPTNTIANNLRARVHLALSVLCNSEFPVSWNVLYATHSFNTYLLGIYSVLKRSTNFFCEKVDSKYFRLWGPYKYCFPCFFLFFTLLLLNQVLLFLSLQPFEKL